MEKTVAICIPTIGNLHWRFAADLMALQLPSNTRVIWQVRTMIDTARNLLKLPAPPTDNKIKKEIALSAEVLKNEPNFLDHFEALGRDYANKRFLQLNNVVV